MLFAVVQIAPTVRFDGKLLGKMAGDRTSETQWSRITFSFRTAPTVRFNGKLDTLKYCRVGYC